MRKQTEIPTVHVDLDGGGHRVADVVVAGLAGQDGVEVLAAQVVQHEGVDSFVWVRVLIRAIDEGVLPPPIELRGGGA